MTEYEAQVRYGSIPISDFLELIARGDDDSMYAAFFLMRYRLIDKLKGIYYKKHISRSFDDTLEDFYFYFKDGKSGNNTIPFQGVNAVKNRTSFQSWLLTMFSNYMSDQIAAEANEREGKEKMPGRGMLAGGDYDPESDSQIQTLGAYIAHFDATSSATDRLVLYRYLLKKLFGASTLIPSHEFAPILSLTATGYRKKTEYLKKAFIAQLGNMQRGESDIVLDEAQQELAERIDREFAFFQTIIDELYDKAIDDAGCKDALEEIRARRKEKKRCNNETPKTSDSLIRPERHKMVRDSAMEYEHYSPSLRISFSQAEGRYSILEKFIKSFRTQ